MTRTAVSGVILNVHMYTKLFMLFLGGLVLAACAAAPPTPHVNALSPVTQDEVILVGKVLLDPPVMEDLKAVEEDRSFFSGVLDESRNKAQFLISSAPLGAANAEAGEPNRYIEAGFGRSFFVRVQALPFYVTSLDLVLEDAERGTLRSRIPVNYRVDLKKDDRIVYIGTLRYVRDDSGQVLGSKLIDQFDLAQKEVKKKFGAGVKLRKSLVRDVPSKVKTIPLTMP
jgi:hypothetical protein